MVKSETSLLSFYTFDNATAQDIAGNASGTLNGSAQFGPGIAGGPDLSLSLDGDGWVNIHPLGDPNQIDEDRTIDLWLRALWAESSYDPAIISSLPDGGSLINFIVYLDRAKDHLYMSDGDIMISVFELPQNAGTNWGQQIPCIRSPTLTWVTPGGTA